MCLVRCLSGGKPNVYILTLALAVALEVFAGQTQARPQDPGTASQKAAPALGTIQAVTDKTLALKTDAGAEVAVQFTPAMRVLRVEPGSKTLKDAVAIPLTELAVGDRVLVRGEATGPNAMAAATIVAMKKEDIAKKQAREREEWQRRGIGGLVKAVDPAKETIVVSTTNAAGSKDVTIRAPVGTILRRYAPGSVNFDEAKVAPLAEIQPGDQLRARGSRSADGAEFTADEIVSGTFHNISGTISAIDAAKSTLTVSDLATKKNVELTVTADSQMRKLPAPVAQRIAMRLKGLSPDAAAPNGAPAQGTPTPAAAGGGPAGPAGGQRAGGDMQQMLSRLPVSPLGDFQKGDAVMVVATTGGDASRPTVITLLGGVEPILQSAPQGQASSILTPWSLNSGGGAEAGTP
jgi:hypothetical protein